MEKKRGAAELQAGKGRSRLLLFPLPLQGHIIPMFQLAEILYSKGFSITIIHTDFNAPNPENYPHWEFRSISIDLTDDFEVSATNVLELISEINVKCVQPFRIALSQLLDDDIVTPPVSCLIRDSLLYFTRAVTATFELPQIVLRTGGISSFLAYTAFPFLQEKGYLPVQGFPDSRLEETIPELPMLRVKDLPVMEGNYELLKMMIQETKASSGVIWNSFEELEEPALATLRHMFSSIQLFPIGPFHKFFPASSTSRRRSMRSSSSLIITPDKGCISWLDKQERGSVIYVSFGSLAQMDENQFLEIASALANSKHPFLWVIRSAGGGSSKSLLPPGYGILQEIIEEGRGEIVNWAPQREVLAHPAVAAFWTHNGWNSTIESICEGVPMICTPFFADQLLNARYVTHVWKVGLGVEIGWKKEKIQQVIKKLMEEKEGSEDIRRRALQLKELADICLRPGGSSDESLNKLANFISSF